ncbi:DUF3085 domain-containing protein [Streptomyces luteireticuli]|uniref:DUF3085 domain-containing protein n=1 Tax=Streptomyces luteireticuli TaxID=173858 RepID=UPI003558FAFF
MTQNTPTPAPTPDSTPTPAPVSTPVSASSPAPVSSAAPASTPTPAVPGSIETAIDHPGQVRQLLALPADQRPGWLNAFLGTMTIPPISDTSTNPLLDVVMANTAHRDCTLVFPLDQVLAVAEHAANATEHAFGDGEREAAPGLWWVKDDGAYLMSNGQQSTGVRVKDGRLPHTVYADSWGPGTDPRSILGGDDFCQSIDLTAPLTGDGTTLLDMLRAGAADGATHYRMQIVFDDEYLHLTHIID